MLRRTNGIRVYSSYEARFYGFTTREKVSLRLEEGIVLQPVDLTAIKKRNDEAFEEIETNLRKTTNSIISMIDDLHEEWKRSRELV